MTPDQLVFCRPMRFMNYSILPETKNAQKIEIAIPKIARLKNDLNRTLTTLCEAKDRQEAIKTAKSIVRITTNQLNQIQNDLL